MKFLAFTTVMFLLACGSSSKDKAGGGGAQNAPLNLASDFSIKDAAGIARTGKLSLTDDGNSGVVVLDKFGKVLNDGKIALENGGELRMLYSAILGNGDVMMRLNNYDSLGQDDRASDVPLPRGTEIMLPNGQRLTKDCWNVVRMVRSTGEYSCFTKNGPDTSLLSHSNSVFAKDGSIVSIPQSTEGTDIVAIFATDGSVRKVAAPGAIVLHKILDNNVLIYDKSGDQFGVVDLDTNESLNFNANYYYGSDSNHILIRNSDSEVTLYGDTLSTKVFSIGDDVKNMLINGSMGRSLGMVDGLTTSLDYNGRLVSLDEAQNKVSVDESMLLNFGSISSSIFLGENKILFQTDTLDIFIRKASATLVTGNLHDVKLTNIDSQARKFAVAGDKVLALTWNNEVVSIDLTTGESVKSEVGNVADIQSF